MKTRAEAGSGRDKPALSTAEFVALIAMTFALIAFSTDAMLPAFPSMGAELAAQDPNRISLVISVFMVALGVGTFLAGPFADTYGRKPVVIGGVALFILGSLISYYAVSLETLLAGRFLQGLGAAGPRIAPLAMVRDLYEGRRMAQITSFIMTVFMLVPAVAPYCGSLIIGALGWRAVFAAFILFAVLVALWMTIRQPETLHPEFRRPLRLAEVTGAAKEVALNRDVLLYSAVLSLGFAELLAVISSIQPVYDVYFGKVESFPLWFALGALVAATGTIFNAVLVMSLGMRRLALTAIAVKLAFTAVALVVMKGELLTGTAGFAFWFIWSTSIFFFAGLVFGNLNALALRPLGHIAGTAASLITGVSTVVAALITIPIGLAFDGTPVPLVFGNLCCSVLAYALMRRTIDD